MTDIEKLKGKDDFIDKLDIFKSIEERLDSLLKETEDVRVPFMENKDIQSWLSDKLADKYK